MATRTQKAAKKAKSEAKAETEYAKAHAAAQDAVAKPAPKKAAKKTGTKAAPKAAKKPKAAKPEAPATPEFEPYPEPKRTSFAERFWHRIGMRAQKKEAEAHQREAEIEFQQAEAQRAKEQAEAEARKAAEAEERRKAAQSARELKRAAEEEDRRRKEEAKQARLRAAAEERAAKERAAAEEQAAKERAKQEKADKARAAREAKREAARAKEAEAAQALAERKQRAQYEREVAAAEAAARAEAKRQKVVEMVDEPEEVEVVEVEVPAEPEPKPEPDPEPVRAKPASAAKAVPADEDEDGEEDGDDEPTPAKAPARAPKPEPANDLERHADKLAEELASRRSKPITIEVEDEAVPTLPVGRSTRTEEPKEVLQLDPAPPARVADAPQIRGLSIPEHYLLLALSDGWDERTERNKPGKLGGGLTGALLLELVMQGALKVQRDRFVLQNADLDDAAEAVARKVQQYAQLPSLRAMAEIAKWVPQLYPAYKDRMVSRGLIDYKQWRHLGLAYRSQTALLDEEAQERLRNKLARAIAGGGRPDAPTILSLGLLEASGLFDLVVPPGAQAYNRKRLNGLLGGKDVMGYKVDDQLKGIQEIAVRTILDNVRTMTTKG